ncbi:MAG: thiamine pyrophosphate-dependent enzyme, partial [Halopseudomonas sp.]
MDAAAQIDQQFIDRISQYTGPDSDARLTGIGEPVNPEMLLEWFDSQLMSRQLDLWSRRMQPQGKVFYSIGSSGHEAMAAVAAALKPTDLALLHYRDCAFQIQRAKQLREQFSDSTILRDLQLSFVASSLDPISGGRHKVLGSKALNIPPQTSTIASHLPKAVGAAYGIGLSRKLKHASPYPLDSLVLCSFGDASLNHSTAQGAINSAGWIAQQHNPLPLILVCEDNGLGISTPTPNGWVEASCAHRPGLHYLSCNGLDLIDSYRTSRQAVELARVKRQPVLLHFRCIRLLGHAGADNELSYLSREQIEAVQRQDPLLNSA